MSDSERLDFIKRVFRCTDDNHELLIALKDYVAAGFGAAAQASAYSTTKGCI